MANESNPVATKTGGMPVWGRGVSTSTATDATGQTVLSIPRQTTFVGTLCVSVFGGTTAPSGSPSVTVSVEGSGGIPDDESDIFYARIPLVANFSDMWVIPVVVAARQNAVTLQMEQVGTLGTTPELTCIAQGVFN